MIAFPNIDPILLQVGPIAIRWYSLAYIFGALLPIYVFKSLFRKQNMSVDDAFNLVSYIMIGVIFGGRLGYVLFYDWQYYLLYPGAIFAIWEGGMSYHGGALGASIGVWLYSRVYQKSLWSLLDILAISSTIGLFFGRIANFINAELYGRVTDVYWGMIFPGAGSLPRHPSQLYEAFFEGVVLFCILYFVQKKLNPKPGVLFSWYLIIYSFFRFFIEFYRMPDSKLGLIAGPFSMGQVLCIVYFVLGLILNSLQNKKSNE
jgi:phosphatidylglycerol:prolipoprotein diacylglycerol transferase